MTKVKEFKSSSRCMNVASHNHTVNEVYEKSGPGELWRNPPLIQRSLSSPKTTSVVESDDLSGQQQVEWVPRHFDRPILYQPGAFGSMIQRRTFSRSEIQSQLTTQLPYWDSEGLKDYYMDDATGSKGGKGRSACDLCRHRKVESPHKFPCLTFLI